MISTLAWIKQGIPIEEPKKQVLNDEEYAEIMGRISKELETAKNSKSSKEETNENKSEDSSLGSEEELSDSGDALFQDVKKLTMKDEIIGEGIEEEEEEDLADLQISPSDRLLVCGRTEDEVSYLDVYVYEEDDKNLFVHHDLMIPTFPLAVSPINTKLQAEDEGQNFLAIGTFDPDIEIWNLDVIDASFPTIILKGQPKTEDSSSKKDKKNKKANKNIDPNGGHSDAVMTMSWNPSNPDYLLSGSADKTIKLWNLKTQKVEKTFSHHSDKVQTIQWSLHEPSVFASAGYDKKLFVTQVTTGEVLELDSELPCDPECLVWDPHHPGVLALSLEDGSVRFYNISSENRLLFTISCHLSSCTSISFNPFVPGLLLTAGSDKFLKIWSFVLDGSEEVKCLIEWEESLGKIFAASFCADNPWLIAAAGSKATLKVFNLIDFSTTKEFISTKISQMIQ
jgi:periodic tryptophan protein 1